MRREVPAAVVAAVVLLAGCVGGAPGWVRSAQARYGEPIALPAPRVDSGTSLEAAIADRRSSRSFADEPLDRATLGQLLWAGQGITGADGKRAAPSAGGLHPLELYVVSASEVLHYLPEGHRVEGRSVPDLRPRLQRAAFDQAPAGRAPDVIVVAAVPDRTRVEYGDQAGAYVQLEAGHATENVLLQASALGLAAVPIGGLEPDEVAAVLSLPPGEEVLYLVPVGRPG